jgi:hypothetical protein
MPSKKRYILFTPEQNYRGSQVVAMLCKMTQAKLFDLKLPDKWVAYNTQEKLEFLATFLPPKFKLVIYQEPKWTRKKRSMYIQALQTKFVKKKLLYDEGVVHFINNLDGLGGVNPNGNV